MHWLSIKFGGTSMRFYIKNAMLNNDDIIATFGPWVYNVIRVRV